MARAEFWYRKVSTYPQVWQAAKLEAQFVLKKLKDPFSATGNDLLWVLAWAFHVYGAFIVGEMIGRRNLFGYGLVGPEWQPSRQSFHFSPITW